MARYFYDFNREEFRKIAFFVMKLSKNCKFSNFLIPKRIIFALKTGIGLLLIKNVLKIFLTCKNLQFPFYDPF